MSPIVKAIYNGILYFPIIVLIIGIILSIITLRKHTLISILAITAFLLQIILIQTSPYLLDWMHNNLGNMRVAPNLWIYYLMGMYTIKSILSTMSWLLIIISIFIWRKPKEIAK
jgi:hypothetical protein